MGKPLPLTARPDLITQSFEGCWGSDLIAHETSPAAESYSSLSWVIAELKGSLSSYCPPECLGTKDFKSGTEAKRALYEDIK